MGVNAFGHTRAGVAENHLDGCLVGTCPVKHGGQRVPALMGRVVHFHFFHGVVKEAAEGFIIPAGAYSPFCLSLCQDWQDFLVYWNFSYPRQCFAFLDVDILLAEVHVTGGKADVLSGSHPGVNEYEHVLYSFHCIG